MKLNRRLGVGLVVSVLLAATASILVWVLHTNRALRSEAKARFYEQYNRQQFLMAEQASRTIEGLFATFRRNLTLVASFFRDGEVTREAAERAALSLRAVYGVLSDTPVIDLVLFDREGTCVGIVPDDPTTLGSNYGWREYYRWAKAQGQPGKMYLSPFLRLEGGQQRGAMALIVAEGIYDRGGRFGGVVMMTVNFDELARKHILSLRMGQRGYAWLLDSRNRSILVDPRGKVTGQSYQRVFLPRWPKLYGMAEAARDGRSGMDWYDFEDAADPSRSVRKLVGYSPVRIEDSLWTLGVCTPEKEVEGLFSSFLDRQQGFSLTVAAATLAAAGAALGLLLLWNQSLTREVSSRARDLAEANGKLEQAFEELLAVKRVAAAGRMALGLAHEIRNPLTSIRMNMQIIRKKLPAEGAFREHFSLMEEEILRLNRLLSDVMGFARPRPLRLDTADLFKILRRVLSLTEERLKRSRVEVRTISDGPLPPVLCDAEQLQQVFLNLVLNAVEAMEGQEGRKELEISVHRNGSLLALDFRDSGPGIAPEHRENLFDPFFTTKARGGGLGLSVAESIVVRHGGKLEAGGAPGEGACVTVHLPVAGPPSPHRSAA
ncbi:MAG: two-component sensor histidine kinase [Deltaproteobacteria bacterium]|nr:two-component sensor histidine kinase [Deltaproteobacteria bacterium]